MNTFQKAKGLFLYKAMWVQQHPETPLNVTLYDIIEEFGYANFQGYTWMSGLKESGMNKAFKNGVMSLIFSDESAAIVTIRTTTNSLHLAVLPVKLKYMKMKPAFGKKLNSSQKVKNCFKRFKLQQTLLQDLTSAHL